MKDFAHQYTDDELEALERRITEHYQRVYNELSEKARKYFAVFEKRDAEQLRLLNDGEITEFEYQQWRLAQIGRGKWFEAMRDDAAERLLKANEVAVSYINNETPKIFAVNRNHMAYGLEKEYGNIGFTLYNEEMVKRLIADEQDFLPAPSINVPKDLWWNKKLITSEITSGILQGESISKLADRFQTVTDADRVSAIRNARTFITAAENAGRQDAYNKAEEMGIKGLRKQWLATLDNRTRHSHQKLDGQTVGINEKFKSELGSEMMHPGDFEGGKPGDIYNCRCTMITVEKSGIVAEPLERRARNPETGEWEVISDMNYEEWEKWKKAQEQKAMAEKQVKAPQTTKSAIKTANDLGVKYAQFEKMPLEQVNNAIDAVRTLPKDCVPKVIASGKDVSTVTGRPLGRKADQWWGVTYDYRAFSLRTMQLGYDATDFDGGLIVGLNTQKFKTLDALTKAKKATNDAYFAKTGRYWSFNTDGKATAYHEIGHCFADVRGLPKGFDEASARWAEESACDLLKKPDEAFAEAWAAYHLGDSRLPDYISAIIGGLK